jgi:aryl-alcohol dehydrogenase-like predicted oxidoreductase
MTLNTTLDNVHVQCKGRELMQTRRLGQTDLNLTAVGLGTWAIGGGHWEFGWGPQDDADSIAAIRRALELGINWIDTAAAYGLGHSEEIVGQAIEGCRDQVIVATKCGLVWDDPSTGRIHNRLKRWSVRQEAEDSLRRLGVEVIDLYQIHWPIPDKDIEAAWTEIATLVEEGKVHYTGVSNFDLSQLKRVQAIHPVASVQPPYNMLERQVEQELLSYCATNGIGVVAYSPMASGLLTGKYTREKIAALPGEDWRRHRKVHFQEPELSANLDLIEKLSDFARQHNRSLCQLAVAWVLRRPEVTSAIVGARRPGQIEDVAPAGDWQLTDPEIDEIQALLNEWDARLAEV